MLSCPCAWRAWSTSRLWRRLVAQAARQLDHPVYDCFYLALADREGVPLVTADTRLATKVTGTRWSDLVLPLQPSAISR